MTIAATTKKSLLPFRPNTRQRLVSIQRVTMTAGQRTSIEIPRVGFLAGLFLNVNMTPTIDEGQTVVFANLQPWDAIRRVTVNLNLGTASVVDLSGHGLWCVNHDMLCPGFDPNAPHLFNIGTPPWKYSLFVPIAMNDGNQFNIGLLNLQAPEIRCTLDLSFYNTLAEIGTHITALSGYVDVSYLYYEVPDPARVMYPALVLHRLLEQRDPITATGDFIYTCPRQGTLFQLAHLVTLNSLNVLPYNAPNLIDGMRLVINKTDEIYRFLPEVVNFWNSMRKFATSTPAPIGGSIPVCWLYDFMSANGLLGASDARDTLDSEAVSTLESIITVDPAATVGVAFVDTIRRVVQVLQV